MQLIYILLMAIIGLGLAFLAQYTKAWLFLMAGAAFLIFNVVLISMTGLTIETGKQATFSTIILNATHDTSTSTLTNIETRLPDAIANSMIGLFLALSIWFMYAGIINLLEGKTQ